MTQASGRAPRMSELAEALHLEEEDVAEAISVAHGYRAISLDSDRDDQVAPIELLGEVDASLAATAVRTSVQEALTSLPERDRLIVYLRFFEDMTQSEIAEAVGISQMHVSRLLSKAMDDLGDLLTLED
jgi:RNA polymerase sigma-B factor